MSTCVPSNPGMSTNCNLDCRLVHKLDLMLAETNMVHHPITACHIVTGVLAGSKSEQVSRTAKDLFVSGKRDLAEHFMPAACS